MLFLHRALDFSAVLYLVVWLWLRTHLDCPEAWSFFLHQSRFKSNASAPKVKTKIHSHTYSEMRNVHVGIKVHISRNYLHAENTLNRLAFGVRFVWAMKPKNRTQFDVRRILMEPQALIERATSGTHPHHLQLLIWCILWSKFYSNCKWSQIKLEKMLHLIQLQHRPAAMAVVCAAVPFKSFVLYCIYLNHTSLLRSERIHTKIKDDASGIATDYIIRRLFCV